MPKHNHLPPLSPYNKRRLNRAIGCLHGCLARGNEAKFDPSAYPYRIALGNSLHYKISRIENGEELVLIDKNIYMNKDTDISLVHSDSGTSFVFLLWFKANGGSLTVLHPPAIQSMVVIHIGKICGFLTPYLRQMFGFDGSCRRKFLELLTAMVRRLCIDNVLSENNRMFQLINRRWNRIKLLLLSYNDPNSTFSMFPMEILRHIISFLPKWDEIDWLEDTNGPKGHPVLRKRKNISYSELPKKRVKLDEKNAQRPQRKK